MGWRWLFHVPWEGLLLDVQILLVEHASEVVTIIDEKRPSNCMKPLPADQVSRHDVVWVRFKHPGNCLHLELLVKATPLEEHGEGVTARIPLVLLKNFDAVVCKEEVDDLVLPGTVPRVVI